MSSLKPAQKGLPLRCKIEYWTIWNIVLNSPGQAALWKETDELGMQDTAQRMGSMPSKPANQIFFFFKLISNFLLAWVQRSPLSSPPPNWAAVLVANWRFRLLSH